MDWEAIKAALTPAPRGDKPRKIVICHPDRAAEIQRAIVHDLGHTDVLVKPNGLIPEDVAYVIDAKQLDFHPIFGDPSYFGEAGTP